MLQMNAIEKEYLNGVPFDQFEKRLLYATARDITIPYTYEKFKEK